MYIDNKKVKKSNIYKFKDKGEHIPKNKWLSGLDIYKADQSLSGIKFEKITFFKYRSNKNESELSN